MGYAFVIHKDVIIKENLASTTFFILVRGTEKISRKESPDVFLAELNPGDVFGEVSYLTGQRRSANVVAHSRDVMAMRLSRELIQKMTPEIRDVLKGKLIELLVQRINRMNDDLFTASQK